MKLKLAIVSVAILATLCGCQNNSDLKYERETLQRDVAQLQEEVTDLEEERDYLEEYLSETREENDLKRYVVTFEIKQSHFTLNIKTHLKDAMNKLELEVLVSGEYYNSVDIGTVINDDFRVGSFLMKGSIGSWKVEVVGKRVE